MALLTAARNTLRYRFVVLALLGAWVVTLYLSLVLTGRILLQGVSRVNHAGGELESWEASWQLQKTIVARKSNGSGLKENGGPEHRIVDAGSARKQPAHGNDSSRQFTPAPQNTHNVSAHRAIHKANKSPRLIGGSGAIETVQNPSSKHRNNASAPGLKPSPSAGKSINDSAGVAPRRVAARLSYGPEGPGIASLGRALAGREVVSPHNFRYIINPADFCAGADLFFIVYVHSSPGHEARRRTIRRTWGDPSRHASVFKVLFVFGFTPGNEALQRSLLNESRVHGDLLQEDFIDSYRNLTHKGIAALKWIDHNCDGVKYVLKTDDDTFVNMFIYIRYIRSLERHGADSNLILCAVWYGMTVLRKGKWGVDPAHYNDTSFPTYCSGCAYTLTTDVARAVHRVSYHVPFLWVDDAYITGVLPRRIGNVTFRNFGSTYEMNSDRLNASFTGPRWWGYVFASDVHRVGAVEAVWDKILEKFDRGNVVSNKKGT